MTTLFDVSTQDAIMFASQFGQVLFGCAAVVLAGYLIAHYFGWKPTLAASARRRRRPPAVQSTPLVPVAAVTVLKPWESAILHAEEARDCQEAAYELAGSAEYLWGQMRADLEAIDVALPSSRRTSPPAAGRQIPSSLAA